MPLSFASLTQQHPFVVYDLQMESEFHHIFKPHQLLPLYDSSHTPCSFRLFWVHSTSDDVLPSQIGLLYLTHTLFFLFVTSDSSNMSQPTDPPSSPTFSSLPSYVDGLLQTMLSSIATPEEVTPISLLPEYTLSKIDGLYSLPFQQLIGLCDKLGIAHDDCRIKYHIVSRIKVLEPKLHLLQYALLPSIPEKALVDQYRYQLLSFDGTPDMVSKERAYNMTLSLLRSQQMCMPHKFGQVVVVDFGIVVSHAGFYSSTCLYPVNYHAQKVYTSVFNPDEEITYDCWIKESQGQPLFVISFEGSVVYYDWNINSVWNMVRNRIHDLRCQQKESRKGCRPSMDVGEEFYGLSNRLVQLYLESQPMSLQCSGYIFVSQRSCLGRASEIILQETELNNLQAEYVDMRTRIIRFCTDQSGAKPAQATLETAANKCREILRGSRALERLKRDEWEERDKRLLQVNLNMCAKMLAAREQKTDGGVSDTRKATPPQRKQVRLLPKISLTSGGLPLPDVSTVPVASEPVARPSRRATQREATKQSVKRSAKREDTKQSVKRSTQQENTKPSAKRSARQETTQPPVEQSTTQEATQPPAKQLAQQETTQPPAKRERGMQKRETRRKCVAQLVAEEERPRKRRQSARERFSVDVHVRLVRAITENKQQTTPIVVVPSPPPESTPLPSPQPFSLLPATLTGDALALWDCLCFFRPVFQLPRVSYEAFEFSLAYPQLSDVLDQQMAMVLTLVFTQLRATLMLSDRAQRLAGWKPFQGRACTTATWPEFARLAFVCKTWVLSGSDIAMSLRSFFEDGKHSADEVAVADPLRTPATHTVGRKRQFHLVDPLASQLPLCEKEVVAVAEEDATHDYRGLFDPSAILPPSIDADAADECSVFRLSSQQRFRRLAMELATHDPHELSITMRVAVVSAVLELARDTPQARHFLSLTKKSLVQSRNSFLEEQHAQLLRIRSVCRALTDCVSERRRKRLVGEKSVAKGRSRGESRRSGWTANELETLEKAVDELGEGHWSDVAASYAMALRHRSAAGRVDSVLPRSDSREVERARERPRGAVPRPAVLRRHHDRLAGHGDVADGRHAPRRVSRRLPLAARAVAVDGPRLLHRARPLPGARVRRGGRRVCISRLHADGSVVAGARQARDRRSRGERTGGVRSDDPRGGDCPLETAWNRAVCELRGSGGGRRGADGDGGSSGSAAVAVAPRLSRLFDDGARGRGDSAGPLGDLADLLRLQRGDHAGLRGLRAARDDDSPAGVVFDV